MTETPQSRLRVPVADTRPEPDPARTGCLWVGGILGVIVGVVIVLFGVPALLNLLFPSETIEVGKTYEDDKLTMRIEAVEIRSSTSTPPYEVLVVQIAVDAESTWTVSPANFVLVLDDGTELRSTEFLLPFDQGEQSGARTRLPQGPSLLYIAFSGRDVAVRQPDSLHLEEPPVKFALKDPVVAWE